MTKTMKLTGILLTLVMLVTMLIAFGMTAAAADGDACTTDSCTGTYTNGFCTVCDGYQSAALNESGYYEIGNAGQLYWFADKVNGDDRWINAVLTADINANPGYTFTFVADTGLVEIKKDTAVVAYVGTDILGDASGSNTVFDTTASIAGTVYANADDATADTVDLSAVRVWTPIGIEYDLSFNGAFDGNGKTVSGLYFNTPDSGTYVGLIGYAGGSPAGSATVKNVTVTNSCVIGYFCVAGIVGFNEKGTVTGCVNEAFINAAFAYSGGITGGNSSTVTGCINRGTIVSVYGGGGGIVGHGSGTVEFCGNEGNVFANSDVIGGIVSENSGIIRSCWNTGKIYADGNLVYGIVKNNYGTVTNSYYLGTSETDSIDGTTFKTTAQFASGEVCCLLGDAFGQAIGTNVTPVFRTESNGVYKNQTGGCTEATYTYEYSNTQNDAVTTHAWDDGEVTTDPTCSAVGVKTFTCTHNGEHTKTEDVAVDGNAHKWLDATYEAPKTCEHCGETEGEPLECNHMCHDTGGRRMIWRIFEFISRLFNIETTCSCGKPH